MDSKPAYFAIIPAEVRYDVRLCSGAKLLYGEITSLCNKEGYCWATNKYFSILYGKTPRTIENWISSLVKYGYIYCNLSINKKIQRLISISPLKKISSSPEKNFIPNPIYNNKLNKEKSSLKKKKATWKWGSEEYELRKYQDKWWVIPKDGGDWLEFNGKESEIVFV